MDDIIIPKSNVDLFLEKISEGFQRDNRELLIILLAIALFILLPSLIFLIRRAFIRGRKIREAKKLFQQLLEKKTLSAREKTLIQAMAARCRKERTRLPVLLTDVYFFAKYAHILISRKISNDTELALLRQHLGLHYHTLPVELHSTAEFVRGMPLRLTFTRAGRCRTLLEAVEERGLVVPVKIKPLPGENVVIEFARHAGYYRVESRVLAVMPGQLVLAHCEQITRVQKRRFYRTKIKIEVALKLPGNGPLLPVQLADISGGGAKIRLKELPLQPDQEVELVFNPNRTGTFQVSGRVIRLAPRQGAYSIVFHIERENERDRIIRLMHQGGKARRGLKEKVLP